MPSPDRTALFVAVLFSLFCLCFWAAGAFAQSNNFQPGANPVSNQSYSLRAVTPSDTTKIAATRALFNGSATACTLVVQANGDAATVSFQNVQPGEILPVQAVIVGTASTCSNIIAMY